MTPPAGAYELNYQMVRSNSIQYTNSRTGYQSLTVLSPVFRNSVPHFLITPETCPAEASMVVKYMISYHGMAHYTLNDEYMRE